MTQAPGIPSQIKEGVEPQKIERDVITSIQQKLAIVLPIKDEDVKIFKGVLSGMPHDCLMIVTSNSQQGEIDNLKKEKVAKGRLIRYPITSLWPRYS